MTCYKSIPPDLNGLEIVTIVAPRKSHLPYSSECELVAKPFFPTTTPVLFPFRNLKGNLNWVISIVILII